MRDALLVLGSTMPDFRKAFGSRQNVDPVRHLVGTAMGWGGNPDKDAIYLNVMPEKNNGVTIHKLKVKDVPVNAFWSVSVYNAKGYFEKNSLNAYTINNITAKTDADSSVAIQFGGCDGRFELPAHHEGLELHGTPLPAEAGNSQWQMEVPSAAGDVNESMMTRRNATQAGRAARAISN